MAEIAGTGASALGMGSGNLKVLQGTTQVINTANVVRYSADTFEKIQELGFKPKMGQNVHFVK